MIHVWGSYHAKFDDSFRWIACEGHTHRHLWMKASRWGRYRLVKQNMGALLWTWELRETHRKWCGCRNEETRLKSPKKSISENGIVTIYTSLQLKRNCAIKITPKREEPHWETLQSLCLLRSDVFTEPGRTLACVVSNFFLITHLLTSPNSCRCI